MKSHDYFMKRALEQAQLAFDENEVPIGAIITYQDQVIAGAFNKREQNLNPLHHAEIIALEKASRSLNNWRLNECTLYVTVEPCPMCLGALLQARVGHLVLGCLDPKRDAHSFFNSLKDKKSIHSNNHTLAVTSLVLEAECSALLKEFFKQKRHLPQ